MSKPAARPSAPSQQTLSIRNKHIACLETLLNFNEAVDSKTSWQESWKILIYDNQVNSMAGQRAGAARLPSSFCCSNTGCTFRQKLVLPDDGE
jgi:hypothetical protein